MASRGCHLADHNYHEACRSVPPIIMLRSQLVGMMKPVPIGLMLLTRGLGHFEAMLDRRAAQASLSDASCSG